MSDQLEVTLSTGIFIPNVNAVRVRHRAGLVYLFVDDCLVEMRTPIAHKTGFALVCQAGEAMENEFIILRINGDDLNFPTHNARQIGAALLRKADDADDFQQQMTH